MERRSHVERPLSPKVAELIRRIRSDDPPIRALGMRYNNLGDAYDMKSFDHHEIIAIINSLPGSKIVVALFQGIGIGNQSNRNEIITLLARVLKDTNIICMNLGEIEVDYKIWKKLEDAIPGSLLGSLYINESFLENGQKKRIINKLDENREKPELQRLAIENDSVLLSYNKAWKGTNIKQHEIDQWKRQIDGNDDDDDDADLMEDDVPFSGFTPAIDRRNSNFDIVGGVENIFDDDDGIPGAANTKRARRLSESSSSSSSSSAAASETGTRKKPQKKRRKTQKNKKPTVAFEGSDGPQGATTKLCNKKGNDRRQYPRFSDMSRREQEQQAFLTNPFSDIETDELLLTSQSNASPGEEIAKTTDLNLAAQSIFAFETKKINGNFKPVFVCNLQIRQCVGQCVRPPVRCKQITKKTIPFCSRHLSDLKGLRVDKSLIEGAGSGLFATKTFKRGDRIGFYHGEHIDQATFDRRYGKVPNSIPAPYTYAFEVVRQNYYIDSACLRGYASYINHSAENENVDTIELEVNGIPEIMIVAIKEIAEGEELYLNYGTDEFNSRKKVDNSTLYQHKTSFEMKEDVLNKLLEKSDDVHTNFRETVYASKKFKK